MNTTVELSFIIVNWNAKDFLYKCLHSIIRETSDINAEIIVVDNDSSDGSQAEIKIAFPQVKLIESKINNGFSNLYLK